MKAVDLYNELTTNLSFEKWFELSFNNLGVKQSEYFEVGIETAIYLFDMYGEFEKRDKLIEIKENEYWITIG